MLIYHRCAYIRKVIRMKYEHLELFQSTSYGRECPHGLSISIEFKNKTDRNAFVSQLRKILDPPVMRK